MPPDMHIPMTMAQRLEVGSFKERFKEALDNGKVFDRKSSE